MREVVGELVVDLALNDRGLTSGLAKSEAEVVAAARAMSRNEVNIPVKFDEAGLKRKILSVRKELEEQLLRRDSVVSGGKAFKDAELQIDRLRKKLRELSIEKYDLDIASSVVKQINDAEQAVENFQRSQALMHSSALALNRDLDRQNAITHQRALDLQEQMDRTMAISHQRALDLQEQMDRSVAISHQRALEMDLEKGRSMEILHQRAIEMDIERSRRAHAMHAEALRMNEQFDRRLNMTGVQKGDGNKLWRLLTLGGSGDPRQTLMKLFKEPVNMGPFNVSIRGITLALTAFGPIVASVVGGLTAMAATVGGALTGALSVGLAGVLGFGQGLLGVGLVMAPIIEDFKLATQVTTAYSKAVAKYGENSKQAQKAQEQMNNVLKGMSPVARAAYKDLAAAQTEFAKRTAGARPALERALGSTMGTVRALMPNFAANTVGATNALSAGIGGFMGRLRAEERGGGGFLNVTFKNANAAIKPLIGGLGSLILALGNVGAAASKHLKPLSEGFSRLMSSFLQSTSDKKGINGLMNSLMKDFSSVGRSIGAAGKLLVDFLNVGRGVGRGLFDSLTSTFNRWDRFVKSTEGRKELTTFFSEAANGLRTIGSLILTAGKGFAIFTAVIAPVVTLLRAIGDGILEFVGWLMKFGPAVSVLQGAAAALTGLLIADKVMMMTSKLKLLWQAMMAFKAVAFASNKGFLGALGEGASAYAATKAAGPAVARTALTETGVAAGAAAGQMALFTETSAAATAGVAGLVGPLALAGVGLGGLILVLTQAESQSQMLARRMKELDKSFNTTGLKAMGHVGELATAQQNLGNAADALKAAQDAYRRDPSKRNQQAVNAAKSDLFDQQKAIRDNTAALTKDVDAQQKKINEARAAADKRYRTRGGYKRGDRQAEYAAELRDLAAQQKKLNDLRAGAAITANRQMAGFNDRLDTDAGRKAAAQMTQSLGALRNQMKGDSSLAIKIALSSPDPAQVSQVANRATQALQAGVSAKDVKAAIKGDPRAALATLNRLIAQINGSSASVRVSAAVGDALSVVYGMVNTFNSLTATVGVRFAGGRAEGGPVVHAANGYDIQTAWGNAARRPKRRAMGKFNEPTFLVGEENRTEYVIATNPAYRSQNIRYLASAAGALGMQVMPAYKGFSPSEIAGALKNPDAGVRSGKDLAKAIKQLNELVKYSDHKSKGYGRNYRKHVDRVRAIRAAINHSKKQVAASRDIQYLQAQEQTLQTMISNDEKSGNTKLLDRHQRDRRGVLQKLIGYYGAALKALPKRSKEHAQIQGQLEQYKGELFDLTHSGSNSEDTQAKLNAAEALNLSYQNAAVIQSAFSDTMSSFFGGGVIASGGGFRPGRYTADNGGIGGNAPGMGGGPSIVINTLHPGDPDTLRAIGAAATGGMSLQGAVGSPRSVVA